MIIILKEKTKKITKITIDILLYCFLGICLLGLISVINYRKSSNEAVAIFNREIRIVVTNSMEKCDLTDVSDYKIKDIPVKSAIIIEKVPENKEKADEWYDKLEVGDVLTFKYHYTAQQLTITHRLVEKTEKSTGGYLLKLEGDNKNSEEVLEQIIDTSADDAYDYVIGKVVRVSYPLGVVISSLQSTVGIVCIIIIPSAIIIIYEIIKIVNVLEKDKKLKLEEESSKKDSEIEELKKRLATLEKEKEGKKEDS